MFQRRILHHGSNPHATPVLLQERAVSGCWFELHRRGGCGAGEVVLSDEFPDRRLIDIGDWISFEAAPGDRWYLGRVEERHATSPAAVRLRLEGMGVELSEVFPGGFASDVDGVPPHRFAATDLFPHDPDRGLELVDSVDSADALVRLLLERYVVPATHIISDPSLIEPPLHPAPVSSLKFRGEESVTAIIKELGLRAQAAWGVDARGQFFFLRQMPTVLKVWREGRDLTSLSETRDRELLFNRVLLTGDYVYDHPDATDDLARRSYRWRGNYTQPESRAEFGDRRIRLWVPWLRTAVDSLAFVREFFRIYAQPAARFQIETAPQASLPLPWHGVVRLEDRHGEVLFVGPIESVRIDFDHAPRFRLELGPEDPRHLWPEPPHDERWELPNGGQPGGPVSLTSRWPLTSSSGDDGPDSADLMSGERSEDSSLDSSAYLSTGSSAWSSLDSSWPSSWETQASTLSGSSFASTVDTRGSSMSGRSTGDSADSATPSSSSDSSQAASAGDTSEASSSGSLSVSGGSFSSDSTSTPDSSVSSATHSSRDSSHLTTGDGTTDPPSGGATDTTLWPTSSDEFSGIAPSSVSGSSVSGSSSSPASGSRVSGSYVYSYSYAYSTYTTGS